MTTRHPSRIRVAKAKTAVGITFGLSAAGVLIGAACGVLTLAPLLLRLVLHPVPDDVSLLSAGQFAFLAGGAGAVFGSVAGPLLTWSLLRDVPLWRVIVHPTLGAIIGSFLTWLDGSWSLVVFGLPANLLATVVGMIVGVAHVRWIASRARRRHRAW